MNYLLNLFCTLMTQKLLPFWLIRIASFNFSWRNLFLSSQASMAVSTVVRKALNYIQTVLKYRQCSDCRYMYMSSKLNQEKCLCLHLLSLKFFGELSSNSMRLHFISSTKHNQKRKLLLQITSNYDEGRWAKKKHCRFSQRATLIAKQNKSW